MDIFPGKSWQRITRILKETTCIQSIRLKIEDDPRMYCLGENKNVYKVISTVSTLQMIATSKGNGTNYRHTVAQKRKELREVKGDEAA